MDRQDRRDFDSASRFAGSRIILWVVVFIAVAGLIGGISYVIKVATAPAKGWGDQQIIVNDGRNRVNAQEWFAGKYGYVKGQDAKLPGMRENLEATKGTPDEALWRASLTGATNLCLQAIEEYNAESLKISRGQWKSPNLPFSLPDGDATDCK
jgi:hypothetical protein